MRVSRPGPRALAITLLASLLAAGCATRKELPPAFEHVAVQAEVEKDDDGRLEGDLHADTALKGALIGAGAGSVAGATGGAIVGAAAASACGPLAPLCLPINVIAFGGVGAIGGLFVGSGAGAVNGVSRGTAGEVNRILERIEMSRDLTAELQTAMNAAVPADKLVSSEHEADGVVTARIDEFDLRQRFRSQLSLRVSGSMIQTWNGGGPEPSTRTCEYRYFTPLQSSEEWLLDDGQAFDDAFTDSLETLSAWMARDLEAFAQRRAEPETETAPATCFQP